MNAATSSSRSFSSAKTESHHHFRSSMKHMMEFSFLVYVLYKWHEHSVHKKERQAIALAAKAERNALKAKLKQEDAKVAKERLEKTKIEVEAKKEIMIEAHNKSVTSQADLMTTKPNSRDTPAPRPADLPA